MHCCTAARVAPRAALRVPLAAKSYDPFADPFQPQSVKAAYGSTKLAPHPAPAPATFDAEGRGATTLAKAQNEVPIQQAREEFF